MCDPYFELEMKSFKGKYGNPSRYIYGLSLFKGTPPTPKPQPAPDCSQYIEEINNLKAQVLNNENLVVQLRAEKQDILKTLNQANEKIGNLQATILDIQAKNNELKVANQNLTEKIKEIDNIKGSLSACELEKKELEEKLKEVETSYEVVFPLFRDYCIAKIKGRR
jgi:predicted RNase H-like nuclease (RuvC/YqgF family)